MIDWQNVQRAKQWQIVLKALSTLSYRSYDLSSYLREITCGVSQLLESDWSIITLHQESRGQVVASSLDLGGAETEFSVHESVSQVVVQSGQPFLVEDVKQRPEAGNRMAGYVCYLGVPLRTTQGEVIGTICSFSMQPKHYDAEIISTVELFAERAATAIDNHRLYQQQQQFNDRLEAEVTKRTIELREAQAKLIEHERLAAIGEFAAMIVHEIRNPLTTVQMGLNYFTKLDLPQPAQARLSLAVDEAGRLANLLQEILSYAKPQILRLVQINVDIFIRDLLISLEAMPEARGRSIRYLPLYSPIHILGDSDKLKQVFINLIRNACEAIEVGEAVRWSVMEAPEKVCISIQNGGVPIPAEVLSRLTQPFYSTKAEGTGLGLAIVKRIVEAHSGELLIESSELRGTIFSVQLPIVCENQ
jgi:signal transduction histidine kinase